MYIFNKLVDFFLLFVGINLCELVLRKCLFVQQNIIIIRYYKLIFIVKFMKIGVE